MAVGARSGWKSVGRSLDFTGRVVGHRGSCKTSYKAVPGGVWRERIWKVIWERFESLWRWWQVMPLRGKKEDTLDVDFVGCVYRRKCGIRIEETV